MEKSIKKTRSIRVSEDVWKEIQRLRNPLMGLGEQKSLDKLFEYFLVLHHGNLDWRNKVKYVDLNPKLKSELSKLHINYLDNKITKNEYIIQSSKLEQKYYNSVREKIC